MLKRICIFVATLSFLVVLGLPLAQAQSNNLMVVHVPFDFYVRDQMMPAGAYRITALTDDGATLLIRSEDGHEAVAVLDRKSTRLNSSHANISYAVFCLKKKNQQESNIVGLLAGDNPRTHT